MMAVERVFRAQRIVAVGPGGRIFQVVLREVAQQVADAFHAFGVVAAVTWATPEMPPCTLGAAQLLGGDVLVRDRAHHVRAR